MGQVSIHVTFLSYQAVSRAWQCNTWTINRFFLMPWQIAINIPEYWRRNSCLGSTTLSVVAHGGNDIQNSFDGNVSFSSSFRFSTLTELIFPTAKKFSRSLFCRELVFVVVSSVSENYVRILSWHSLVSFQQ